MTLSENQIKACIEQPEHAARLADLVYVTDNHLNIYRKKYGRGYTYLVNNKDRLTNKKELNRIKSLVIPPAWVQVRISGIENGHLQVVGRDDKNRKVYLYHELWNVLRNQTKFFKLSAFARSLPSIRKKLEQDLDLKGMPKAKCIALVLKVMDNTYIRVGNDYYAKRNKTYGLSTLRTRHVNHEDGKIIFDFKGKRSVEQHIEIDDKDLIKAIQQCEEIPGWELFQYYDDDGKHNSISSSDINDYLHQISKDIFTAKDFRTWGATREFFEFLVEKSDVNDEKERESLILKAYDAAADALGNTRNVCRQYYVHPYIADVYQERGYQKEKEALKKIVSDDYFTVTEKVLLDLIDNFELEITTDK